MKRILAGILALALMFTSVDLTAFAADYTDVESEKRDGRGSISAALKLNYPEQLKTVGKKNLKARLMDDTGAVIAEIGLGEKTEDEQSFSVSADQNGTARVEALNESGILITTETEVNYYNVDFSGLPGNRDYQIALEGKGYKSYLSDKITLCGFSKKIVLDTGSAAFTMGDVNGDGAVDKEDLNAAEAYLGTNSPTVDLNMDGIVDITDIALVNRNRNAIGNADLFDTQVIAEAVAKIEDISENVEVVGGDAEDILRGDEAVVEFRAKEGRELSIPVTFEEPVLMEQIEIASPAASGAIEEGTATIDYEENGKIYTEKYAFSNEMPKGVHAIESREGKSTVVINLGQRVAVKKVTITVTKAVNQEGEAAYAVVQEIKFLKDIVPANPNNESSIPQNLQAEEENESVTLIWTPVDNVTGYLVKYGLETGNYTEQLSVESNAVQVKGLKNLTSYYFIVYAVNDDWRGLASKEIEAVPQPQSPPSAPDHLKIASGDNSLKASWGKTKNAQTYSVYYKVTDGSAGYTKVKSGLGATSCVISDLVNDIEYSVYVTATNAKGESKPSLVSTGIPKREEIEPPAIPTLNRIPNSDVIGIEMTNRNNVNPSYGGTFKVEDVLDGDYFTHWTARAFWESKEFIFEFNNPKTMDYVVYVPRLDGNYRNNLNKYKIRVWNSDGEVTTVANWLNYKGSPRTTGFAILTFPKTEDIKKIGIEMNQWDGAGNISLAEMAFYSYSGINEKVEALFANKCFTELAEGVTEQQIDDLEELLNSAKGYYVDQSILLDEVALARGLLNNDESALGKVIDQVDSRNTKGNQKVINTFQPMGVTANAGKQIVIYADIPEGETVRVTPTQYYAEASSWAGNAVSLTSGRNVIKIPQLTTVSGEKGGALYLQYFGERQNEIKLQVRGEYTQLTVLELSRWDDMTKEQRRETISRYIDELAAYVQGLGKNLNAAALQTNIKNSTEISLPNVLLTLPAVPVWNALNAVAVEEDTKNAQEEKLYQNALAWEELLTVLYRTHGVDNLKAERSRINIRYARMFAGAFMYASGAHIGIGYGSAGALVQGRPTSVTGQGKANALFGWGIAHEIGHQMDTLGKAEITNNIYSLFGQTYDSGNNDLPSRLETSGRYDKIFTKTAIGAQGLSNDVFVSLGMYWQLHLAYDLEPDANFYNQINKAYREGVGKSLNGDQRFAVAASYVAQRDLTEFFQRWGIVIGEEAKAEMGKYASESRKLYYLNDESRRAAMSGTEPVTGSIRIETSVDQREVQLTITGLDGKDIQGYEIIRNGKSVGFTREPSYTDVIGSMNNREVNYTVRAIDILGNQITEAQAEPIKLQHDNLVPRESWSYEADANGDIIVTMMDENISIAGIHIKGHGGTEAVSVYSGSEEPGTELSASGDKSTVEEMELWEPEEKSDNRFSIAVSEDGAEYKEIMTFDQDAAGSEDKTWLFTREDGRVETYREKYIRISNLPPELSMEDMDFMAYPGDDIAISDTAIGYLKEDYRYGEDEEDVIRAGTLIVTGNYRGDPVYNTILLQGRYNKADLNADNSDLEERAIAGETLLFAQMPNEGDMTTVNNGFWIFIPDVQREVELGGNSCSNSLLPAEIKAVMYRTDDPENADSKRLVSETLWVQSPTEDTMPDIVLQADGGINQ